MTTSVRLYECVSCHESKPAEAFSPSRLKRIGQFGLICRPCASAYQRNYLQTPSGRRAAAKSALTTIWRHNVALHSEGIDQSTIDFLYKEQEGRCAACGDSTALFPLTDRDGQLSDLLCRPCHLLVSFGLPANRYRLVGDYLSRFTGQVQTAGL